MAVRAGTYLITLGTLAGPTPRARRAQSSNLLIVNGSHYVIDAGDGVARRLAKAGVALSDIGTIFITHHHDDHIAGLGPLMSAAWNQNRTMPINVYGPPGTKTLVEAVVQYFSLSSAIRIADGGRRVPIAQLFFGYDVGVGEIFRDDNIAVKAIENTHFGFHSVETGRQKPVSYAYRFETLDRVIVFTGDTGPSQAVTDFARDADFLVTEVNSVEDRKQAMMKDGRWQAMTERERIGVLRQATQGHLTADIVGAMAKNANVGAVVLTHLTYRPPPNTDNYDSWADEVRRHFAGPVFVADDLMKF